MKKLLLTMGAMAVSLSMLGSERILYQQNFESVNTPQEAGWSFNGASMTIGSDMQGKFLDLQLGQNNGRSGKVTWGEDIFLTGEGQSVLPDGEYTVEYSFCIKTAPNNQTGTSMTVFTNHTPVDNQGYRLPWNPAGVWNNFVLDISQTDQAVANDMTMAVNAPIITTTNADGNDINTIDASKAVLFNTGAWYTAIANVNVNTRKVEYVVNDIQGEEVIGGEWTVPETDANDDAVSMYAQGLYVMLSRYQTNILIDDIKVFFTSSEDYANPPTVALTRLGQTEDEQLNLNMRAYTITFLADETLMVRGTDGTTETIEWADCDGAYVYETTTSGTLEAWTTCGNATSEVIKTSVDCSPCPLPTVVTTISAVSAGFGKSFRLTVDNADVPLRPNIFIDYEFTGTSGQKLSGEGLTSGETVTVTEEGVLKLTSTAFGYQATSTNYDNNIEFEVKTVYDFARQTDEQLAEKGFTEWQTINSGNKSGFDSWTGRCRLYYLEREDAKLVVGDNGDGYPDQCEGVAFPFGFISADDTENVLHECTIENPDGSVYFENLDIWTGKNIGWLKHIGVYNNQTSGGNNKTITVKNLDKTDFVVANNIGGYGGNSNHPVCSSREEYYQKLEGDNTVYSVAEVGEPDTANEGKYVVYHDVYRIDTACTKITVFAQKGAQGGVEGIAADEVENTDSYYYTIDGLRLAEPTRPGLYIHKGKKIIVK